MVFDSLKNKFQLRFKNRDTAASILAGALEDSLRKIKVDKKRNNLIILGIPRGGVVVADIVTSKLKSSYTYIEFDIIVPRRLGAPGNQERSIGSILEQEEKYDGGDGTTTTTYLNDDLIKELGISREYIEKEKALQIEEIKRRKSLYRSPKKEYNIEDKVVVLVDDGAATGATLIAASRWIRKENPRKLIIAIPVATKDTVEELKRECDMVVTGTTASSTSAFKSVGQYYQEFKPVDDDMVIEICKRNNLLS